DQKYFVIAFTDEEHRMLGHAIAGQAGCNGLIPLEGWNFSFGWTEGWHVCAGKTAKLGHERRRTGLARQPCILTKGRSRRCNQRKPGCEACRSAKLSSLHLDFSCSTTRRLRHSRAGCLSDAGFQRSGSQ